MHAYAGRQFVPFLLWSLVWPGWEANSRPTVREADTLPTEPTRHGNHHLVNRDVTQNNPLIYHISTLQSICTQYNYFAAYVLGFHIVYFRSNHQCSQLIGLLRRICHIKFQYQSILTCFVILDRFCNIHCIPFNKDYVFIRPSFDGRIMLWRCPSVRTSVRLYVRPSVRSVVHNPCGQDIARTIWPRMLKLSMYT